jgi:hypothetical protein
MLNNDKLQNLTKLGFVFWTLKGYRIVGKVEGEEPTEL